MPDKLDSMLKDYFSLRNIRPPSLMQQQKMKQKILEYEHSKNARWSIAAIMLFFSIIWAFNFQRKINLAQNNNETRFITGERVQVSKEALLRWRLP